MTCPERILTPTQVCHHVISLLLHFCCRLFFLYFVPVCICFLSSSVRNRIDITGVIVCQMILFICNSCLIYIDPDEMIYDDVEVGEEGGCNSSLDNGWSSSEFESYDENSEGEGCPENGVPHAFMRRKPPQRKTHVCITVAFLFLLQRTTTVMSVCYTAAWGWRRQGQKRNSISNW